MSTYTYESLKALHNDSLREILRQRNAHNFSTAKKELLIQMILNPSLVPASKSPGRPKGSGVKTPTGAPKVKKPRAVGKTELTVEYTATGLRGTTADVLRRLAKHQGIEAVSNKHKEDLITLLLAKQLANSVVISVQTKAGAESTVTVLASGVRGAVGSVLPASVQATYIAAPVQPSAQLVSMHVAAPPPVTQYAQVQAAAPSMPRISPRLSGSLIPQTSYVPSVQYRQ